MRKRKTSHPSKHRRHPQKVSKSPGEGTTAWADPTVPTPNIYKHGKSKPDKNEMTKSCWWFG